MSKDSELLPEWQVKHKLSFLLSPSTQLFTQLTFQGHVCRWIAQVTPASLPLCRAAAWGELKTQLRTQNKTCKRTGAAQVARGILVVENPHPSKPGDFKFFVIKPHSI